MSLYVDKLLSSGHVLTVEAILIILVRDYLLGDTILSFNNCNMGANCKCHQKMALLLRMA